MIMMMMMREKDATGSHINHWMNVNMKTEELHHTVNTGVLQ